LKEGVPGRVRGACEIPEPRGTRAVSLLAADWQDCITVPMAHSTPIQGLQATHRNGAAELPLRT